MKKLANKAFFSPLSLSGIIFALGFFTLLAVLGAVLDLPASLPWATLFAFAALFFLKYPLFLLGLLLVSRMSLDYLSETSRIFLSDQFSFTLSQALGVFLLFLSVGLLFLYRSELKNFVLWKPFALLIAFGLLSTAISLAPLTSLQEVARLISIFTIGFLAYLSVGQAKDVKKIFLLLLLSSFLPIATACYQLVSGIGMTDSSLDVARIYGTFAHPNVLALFLYSMCVTATLLFFWPPEKSAVIPTARRAWLVFYALAAGLLLLLTFTRVAWIATFLFVLAIALWRYRILLFPLLLLPLVLFIMNDSIRERVTESFETNPDSSIVWRQEIWQDVTAKLSVDNKKLFGTGLDTFTEYAESLRGIRFGSTDAHNDFVKFYVEGGYIGLAVFLLFLGWLAYYIHTLFFLPHAYRPVVLLFAIYAVTLLLSSLSDNVYKDTPIQWVFYIIFGALLGLARLKKENRL